MKHILLVATMLLQAKYLIYIKRLSLRFVLGYQESGSS